MLQCLVSEWRTEYFLRSWKGLSGYISGQQLSNVKYKCGFLIEGGPIGIDCFFVSIIIDSGS